MLLTILLILLIVLILALLGGFYPWGAPPSPRPVYHGYGFGWPGGVLGLVIVIILLLAVLGRI